MFLKSKRCLIPKKNVRRRVAEKEQKTQQGFYAVLLETRHREKFLKAYGLERLFLRLPLEVCSLFFELLDLNLEFVFYIGDGVAQILVLAGRPQ